MVSLPIANAATSVVLMVLDQLPEAFTRAVFPALSVLPLEKVRLTVAFATPVPVMVKLVPVPASMFEMMSSAVMASIVGGGATSTEKSRVATPLVR